MKSPMTSKSTTKDARQQDRNQIIPFYHHKNAVTEELQDPGVLNTSEKFQGCEIYKEVWKIIGDCATKEKVARECSRGQNSLKETRHSQPAKAWLGELCLHTLQTQQTDHLKSRHNLYPLRVIYLSWTVLLDWTWNFSSLYRLNEVFWNTHTTGRCFCRIQILLWRRKSLLGLMDSGSGPKTTGYLICLLSFLNLNFQKNP